MATLPGRVFLDGSFFLSVLWMFYAISILTAIFLLRKLLIFLWGFLYITDCFSLAVFKILSFVFNFDTFSSVQSLSHVWLFMIPWTGARQASLPITNSQSPPKLMYTQSVMPSNHLILCRPLLFLPSIFPNIRVFSNESALCIRWPKYWSFSFSISPSNEHPGLISFRMDWLDFLAVQGTLKSLLTPQLKSINSSVLSFPYSPSLTYTHDYWKNHSFD